MITQHNISAFLQLLHQGICLDVRSPAEFAKGHLPGAINLPLFSNEERAEVGTIYKKQSREDAIKRGLELVGPKMRGFIEATEQALQQHRELCAETKENAKQVAVYCWRGGMRSGSMAWLLGMYGFTVHTLKRGYKGFRAFVQQSFEQKYPLLILGGNTGAGKTHILHELQRHGECTIDIERLAGHKGSAFGWLGEGYQPTQEHFENMLAMELTKHAQSARIWVEDESRRIGNVNLPAGLWEQMRAARVMYIDMPSSLRIENLVEDYGLFSRQELEDSLNRIHQRLGGAAVKEAAMALAENNYRRVAEIALHYYDKYYRRGLEQREADSIQKISTQSRNHAANAELLRSVIEHGASSRD